MVSIWPFLLPRLQSAKSGACLVESDQGKICIVYLRDGVVHHAECGEKTGFAALTNIQKWNGVSSLRWLSDRKSKESSLVLHEAALFHYCRSQFEGLEIPKNKDPHTVLRVVQTGELFPIHSSTAIIGRAPHNDICLPYPSISRQHVLLTFYDEIYVHDMTSHNGTYVDGEKVDFGRVQAPAPLFVSDVGCWIEPYQPDVHDFEKPIERIEQQLDLNTSMEEVGSKTIRIKALDSGFIESLRQHNQELFSGRPN